MFHLQRPTSIKYLRERDRKESKTNKEPIRYTLSEKIEHPQKKILHIVPASKQKVKRAADTLLRKDRKQPPKDIKSITAP